MSRYSFFRHLLCCLVAVIIVLPMMTATSLTQPSSDDPDAVNGHPIWDATVVSILGSPGEVAPGAASLGRHEGHLGWDKATDQRLDDPTARLVTAPDPEFTALMAEKLAALDSSRLIYRSGYEQRVDPGLDATWMAQVAAVPDDGLADGADSDLAYTPVYGAIQFGLPFDTAARYELEQIGVRFYNYVEGGGIYARVPASALTNLQSLIAAGRVRYAGPIPLEARLETALMDKALTDPDALLDVTLQLFDVPSEAQLAQIEQFLQVESSSLHPALPLLQGSLRAGDALALAGLPYVRWLEISLPNTSSNMESTMALGTDALRAEDPTGSTGAGVQVGVMDTGIANPYHTDLPSSRVIDQYEYYPGDDSTADDQVNHGTHVAGIIGGSRAGSSGNWVQGHAPGVDFLVYKLCCDASNTGYPDTGFQNSLTRGANNDMDISNNSWGGGNGVYRTNAEIADRAVRGEYGSRYINMVISSGNDNDLISSPGTAKNAITVGAVKDGNWPNVTLSWTACNDENWPPGERVCFSNFGPIDIDGDTHNRVKPDVVATGVRVHSTIPGDTYDEMDGTSMAAPAVAGAIAALLDHYSDSTSWLFDWPETVKAIVLAQAVDIGGNTDMYGRGLVDIFHMVYVQPGITGLSNWWGNTLTTSNSSMDFTFDVPTGYSYVRVVLTWPDPAGTAGVANDLDLRVYNNSTCSGSSVGESTSYDDPVEFVQVNAGPASGTWCARVNGISLSENQTFGLATFPVITLPTLSVSASVDDATPAPGDYIYFHTTVTNGGNTAGGSYVRVDVPAGFTIEGARIYTADGRSHYYDDSELYNAGDGFWRVATGAVINGHPRLVRWFIRVDDTIADGTYTFYTDAYYLNAGTTTRSTNVASTSVTIHTSTPTSTPTNTPTPTSTPTHTPTPTSTPTHTPTPTPPDYLVYLPLILRNHTSSSIIFSDDFSDPNSGWATGDYEHGKLAYVNGEYQVQVKSGNYAYRTTAPGVQCSNCSIDVDARFEGTPYNSYGMIFAKQDSDYYALFVWPASGKCDLMKRTGSGWDTLASTTSNHVQQTNNHLRVEWQEPAIRTYVNGYVVHDTTDSSFSGARGVGVITNLQGDARFDNFVVGGLP